MNRVNNNDNTSSKRGKGRVRAAAGLLLAALLLPGCKTLNESPQNERFWFPTLAPPTQKEREMRSYNYPEGGDPFVDAEVGPKTFNTRPRGWFDQRSKTSDVLREYPDVEYD
ncbi:MAG: hypothetical protein II561_08725 [Thermoguttaceae bacterium]|nr:hypothetical protein [Thermoguttaceae bacterium]MBQ2556622.1 hypothetical protein [Thermoguttaceae bacterium]MBQ4195910.1 hypothetical protein [Thermoguttaceae bacterium]MBQ4202714.1 hypothetical protein [Thermoguttaceae bacterium]MBQ5366101.1 hypothetical protein [Thermoguttaceae bacterium]